MSADRRYPWTISTIGDLIDEGFKMGAWCERHGMRDVDLRVLAVRFGRGETISGLRARACITCAECGRRLDRWQFRPRSSPPGGWNYGTRG